jgi:peptidyl-prolyl cis-trans isomerase A (cyclophilin A)
MVSRLRLVAAVVFLAHYGLSQAHRILEPTKVGVTMTTELGTIELAVDSVRAPITAKNFLRYVDAGFYDGGTFFRTVTMSNQPNNKVKIEVIQCDINPVHEKESFPPIVMESTDKTGILHKNGTMSMARYGPNSATSSFSICVNDQPDLNFGGKRNPDGFGFAGFGQVTKGMDVVKKIHESHAEGQSLSPPIKILSVKRKPY